MTNYYPPSDMDNNSLCLSLSLAIIDTFFFATSKYTPHMILYSIFTKIQSKLPHVYDSNNSVLLTHSIHLHNSREKWKKNCYSYSLMCIISSNTSYLIWRGKNTVHLNLRKGVHMMATDLLYLSLFYLQRVYFFLSSLFIIIQ